MEIVQFMGTGTFSKTIHIFYFFGTTVLKTQHKYDAESS